MSIGKETAIVTGASRGIGLQIAKTLLNSGKNVVVVARKPSEETVSLLRDFEERVHFIAADISVNKDRERVVSETLDKFGGIDLLVNNAGVAPKIRKDMLEITEEDYDYVMNVNLKGTFFLSQCAAKKMEKRGKGRIVNVGSISADAVSVDRAEYCLSKAGIRMATKLFAARLAEKGVGVFEISPGVIDTDMIAPVRGKYEALAASGAIPIGRLGTAFDVAKCVSAIADGAMDYAMGTVFRMDGGLHLLKL